MNNNFLPFEIAELLPKENPNGLYNNLYKHTKYADRLVWCMDDYGNYVIKSIMNNEGSEPSGNHFPIDRTDVDVKGNYVFRSVWGIFDALDWFEKQDCLITANYYMQDNKYHWHFTVDSLLPGLSYQSYDNKQLYPSRREAYIAGIEHCLKIINQQNESNKS